MYVFSLFVYFYTLQELHLPSSNLEDRNDDEESNDFWLNLPRTFSYQSSRFELPLDISVLVTLTPLDYLSRYVSISSSRRQLYNKVYVQKYDNFTIEKFYFKILFFYRFMSNIEVSKMVF